MKMKQTECSETSAYKIQTPGNNPEENIQQDITSFKKAAIGPTTATATYLGD
jgi:hypothetical protein